MGLTFGLLLSRKVIILELYEVTAAQVAAVAGLTLALGITYRLIRDGDAPRLRRKGVRPVPGG